jgi:hypothetical protein
LLHKKLENFKKIIIFQNFKIFDMAPHLGLEKIRWLGLAKIQKLLVILQHMLKNLSKLIDTVFPYFFKKNG